MLSAAFAWTQCRSLGRRCAQTVRHVSWMDISDFQLPYGDSGSFSLAFQFKSVCTAFRCFQISACFRSLLAIMAAAADPAAQSRYLKENVDADFLFLLEEHGVDLALQFAIGQHYKSIRTFAAFTDDSGRGSNGHHCRLRCQA